MAAETKVDNIAFTTQPPAFSDYDKLIENENYDNEIREVSVPREWAEAFIAANFGMAFDEYLEEWDWDSSCQMYEAALSEGVIASDTISGREPGD